jgi:hypothetical protein
MDRNPVSLSGSNVGELGLGCKWGIRILCSAWNPNMKLKVAEIPRGIPPKKEP